MTQAYSDPAREADPRALPDIETFLVDDKGRVDGVPFVLPHEPGETAYGLVAGWYWWVCFPGCLPDGEPEGPFNTEEEAIYDAQLNVDDDDDEGSADA